MRVRVEYNLPEDEHRLELANRAQSMYAALCDLDHLCRLSIKYQDLSDEMVELLDTIRDTVTESGIRELE